jgi:putative phosphoesterase
LRIAVLADIHGNLRALEAVRADLVKRSPDVVVNLGDNVSGPLQAAATADLLMQESYIHIRGNHDRQVIDHPPAEMGPSDRAAHGHLNSRQLAWLASLPATQMLGEDVLLCHGSPGNDLEYLLEQIDGDRVGLASAAQIQARLGNVRASLILCGHTHIPRIVSLPGGVWVVNPGSVGLPAYDDTWTALHYVETGSPHARYAVIDWEPKAMRVDFVNLDYDWESASKEAAQAGRADWAHALATGFALRPSR